MYSEKYMPVISENINDDDASLFIKLRQSLKNSKNFIEAYPNKSSPIVNQMRDYNKFLQSCLRILLSGHKYIVDQQIKKINNASKIIYQFK